MKLIRLAAVLAISVSTLALFDGTALAQSAPGAEPTPGMGMGPGMRAGRGPAAQWGTDFTPGWTLMTRAERNEHRARMRSMTTYEECKAYLDQHHEQMAARAKEKGGKALAQPRRDACAGLKP
ncbi:MAG: hypothetical protein Q7T10_01040 [Rhodoferax sp.]|uniref:hypothetical protein n=1 Tax=Rhodoferax sp. TaxID=50421 RepID=UPI002717CE99|nr:hypothetical protein [Rhodoferax sp.]MDO8447375.1 hypothetical protein [Rhodoferax sp.]